MVNVIPQVELPDSLVEHLKTFSTFFPDKVRFDEDTHSVEVTETLPFELRVSMSYLKIVTDIQDVMENLELVLSDLVTIATYPPANAREGERRYILLTKLFFYELLRIRDAFPRFLKRMEEDGLMSKDEHHASRKLIDEQLSEHYLIRNVYLHGHSIPRSDAEFDLSLVSMASECGYEPKLVPLNGDDPKEYPQMLQSLATKRREGLMNIASDMVSFCQNIINTTAIWVSHHHFPGESASET